MIRDAKSIGFSICEISHLMNAWYNNKMTPSEKLAVLAEKLLSIDDKKKQRKRNEKLD